MESEGKSWRKGGLKEKGMKRIREMESEGKIWRKGGIEGKGRGRIRKILVESERKSWKK